MNFRTKIESSRAAKKSATEEFKKLDKERRSVGSTIGSPILYATEKVASNRFTIDAGHAG